MLKTPTPLQLTLLHPLLLFVIHCMPQLLYVVMLWNAVTFTPLAEATEAEVSSISHLVGAPRGLVEAAVLQH